jgi:hypothetical protein
LCLSIAVFALPGAHFPVFMTFISNALTPLLAFVSWLILTSARDEPRNVVVVGKIVAAFLVLLSAMFTYAALAFFFLVPAFVVVLTDREDWRIRRMQAIRDIVFVLAAAAVYYAIPAGFFAVQYGPRVGVSSQYNLNIHSGVWGKNLIGFATHTLPLAFNLWNIYTNEAVGLLLMTGCGAGLILFKGKTAWTELVQKLILITVLFLLVNCMILVSSTTLVLFRFLWVTGALAVIFVFWNLSSLSGWLLKRSDPRIREFWAVLFLVVGALSAHWIVTQNVRNSNMEIMFVRSKLAEAPKPLSRIHVILPSSHDKGFNNLPSVTDEFNRKTTDYSADTTDLLRAALSGMPDNGSGSLFPCEAPQWVCVQVTPPGKVLVTKTSPADLIVPSPNMIVIEMDELTRRTAP